MSYLSSSGGGGGGRNKIFFFRHATGDNISKPLRVIHGGRTGNITPSLILPHWKEKSRQGERLNEHTISIHSGRIFGLMKYDITATTSRKLKRNKHVNKISSSNTDKKLVKNIFCDIAKDYLHLSYEFILVSFSFRPNYTDIFRCNMHIFFLYILSKSIFI